VKLLGSLLIVLVLTLAPIGCSKPPEAEKQAAKAAMDAAVSAGADKYAAADLEAAKKTWETAESQMKDKKYNEAKKSYIDAKAAFEKAAQAVETGKKALTDQANAALTSIEESWKNVEAMAKKLGKKLKDREAWTTDAKAISEGLVKAKEIIAADPSQAKAKLDDLKTMIDKWENRFKEMGTRPKGSGEKKARQEGTSKEAKGFTIARMAFGTGVENSEPIGISETFPGVTEKVYCFLEATDIAKDTEVSFVWFHGENEMTKVNLPLKMGPKWRTWTFKNLRGAKGDWKVEIKDADGIILKELKFKVE
jgi:hypothetical protein